MLVDKRAILQCLGCLMTKPSLLDDYKIEPEDFAVESFYEIIFSTIYNLYVQGATSIDSFTVDSFLASYEKQHQIFEDGKGVEYCSSALELAELDNFPYYYERLRKFSLLRYIDAIGVDYRLLYDDTVSDPEKQEEEMARLDSQSINDMIDYLDLALVGETKRRFGSDSNSRGQLAGKNMQQLKEKLKDTPEFGVPLQSPIMTTIARGARKGKIYLRSSNSGGGKAIPNDTIIPTPEGFRKVGNIKVGDKLFDRTGKPTTVTGVYPQPEKKQVYEVELADGRIARCCKDHLWTYRTEESEEWQTKSLREILDTEIGNLYLPVNSRVEFPELDDFNISLCEDWASVLIKVYSEKYDIDYSVTGIEAMNTLNDLSQHIYSPDIECTTGEALRDNVISLLRSMGFIASPKGEDGLTFRKDDKIQITDIRATDGYTDMTCFTVDNKEHLFLMNDFIVTHNTRTSIADLCNIAVPWYFDNTKQEWVHTGFCEPSLFISTELLEDEVQTIVMAYVSGVSEEHILNGRYEEGEEERVDRAIEHILASPLYIEIIPDFGIQDIINIIRTYKREKGCGYFVFDYIHMSAKLIAEVTQMSNGVKMREDQVLFLFIDALKNLCVKYDIFILTMTQLNGTYKDSAVKDETMLRGMNSAYDTLSVSSTGLVACY